MTGNRSRRYSLTRPTLVVSPLLSASITARRSALTTSIGKSVLIICEEGSMSVNYRLWRSEMMLWNGVERVLRFNLESDIRYALVGLLRISNPPVSCTYVSNTCTPLARIPLLSSISPLPRSSFVICYENRVKHMSLSLLRK